MSARLAYQRLEAEIAARYGCPYVANIQAADHRQSPLLGGCQPSQ